MEKQIAQELFDELVKAIREERAFLIVDSKSHGYTCYFQVCSLGENGYVATMKKTAACVELYFWIQ